MLIKVNLNIGFPGAEHDDVLELEDDSTIEEIDQTVKEWANNYIEYSWEKAE